MNVLPLKEDGPNRIRNRMKAFFNTESLLHNYQQKVVTNGYPYLRVYGVLAGSVKSLDMEMLLYPFEELM